MQLNGLIFPSPTYPQLNIHLSNPQLIWIPKSKQVKFSSKLGPKLILTQIKPILNDPNEINLINSNNISPLQSYRAQNLKYSFLSSPDDYNILDECSIKKEIQNLSSNKNVEKNNENDTKQNPKIIKQQVYMKDCIPCLLLDSKVNRKSIIIFYHANAEDIFLSRQLVQFVRTYIQIRCLSVEYPNYSVYQAQETTAQQIEQDSLEIFDYLVNECGYKPQDIIVMGRSIGGGPATYLASQRQVGALILVSAFTSLRAVIKDKFFDWAQYLIEERFNNLSRIQNVESPILLIHGQKDNLIYPQHSLDLFNKAKQCQLELVTDMDHVEFDFELNLALPILRFLEKYKFIQQSNEKINFPLEVFPQFNTQSKY